MPTLSKSIAPKWLLPIIGLLILTQRFEFGANNVWSLRYLHHMANSFPVEPQLPSFPSSHQHAALWLAQIALQHSDLAAKGDALAISAWGDVLSTQGDLRGAIQKWDEAGNSASVAQIVRQSATSGQLDEALLAYLGGFMSNIV